MEVRHTLPELRGVQTNTPPTPPRTKLYQIRVAIRAYLYSEVVRIEKEEGQGLALEDCSLRSRSARRLRTLATQGLCEEPALSPDHISGNYDQYSAKLTGHGAHVLGEIMRRCLPDGRILRD